MTMLSPMSTHSWDGRDSGEWLAYFMHCDPWIFSQQYEVTLLCSLEFTLTLHSHVVLCYTPPGFTLLINQTLMNEVCLEDIPFVSPNRVCCLLTLLLLLLTFVYQTESVVFILCCYWCWTSSERVDASLLPSLVSQTQEAVGGLGPNVASFPRAREQG